MRPSRGRPLPSRQRTRGMPGPRYHRRVNTPARNGRSRRGSRERTRRLGPSTNPLDTLCLASHPARNQLILVIRAGEGSRTAVLCLVLLHRWFPWAALALALTGTVCYIPTGWLLSHLGAWWGAHACVGCFYISPPSPCMHYCASLYAPSVVTLIPDRRWRPHAQIKIQCHH